MGSESQPEDQNEVEIVVATSLLAVVWLAAGFFVSYAEMGEAMFFWFIAGSIGAVLFGLVTFALIRICLDRLYEPVVPAFVVTVIWFVLSLFIAIEIAIYWGRASYYRPF